MKQSFFVITFKDKLYVSSKLYSWYQSTTDDIMKAVHFPTYEAAERICNKTKGGEIKEYVLMDIDTFDSQTDMLRAANVQLQEERDDALARLTKLTGQTVQKD